MLICLRIVQIQSPEVSEHHLQSLASLFIRHGTQDKFGLHLVHGHFKIDEDTIMLGSGFGENFSGSWTKPTRSMDVDRDKIHGHIYVLSIENQFIAYEYRKGASPVNKREMHPAFFDELTKYLARNDLAGLLGLQVLNSPTVLGERMLEFVLGREGTVMLGEQDVNHGGIYRITGWSFEQSEDGIISVKGGESHARTVRGTHQVFTDGKPLPTVEAVQKVLHEEGVI